MGSSVVFCCRVEESCSRFQCALPIAWVKVMRHIAKIFLWKTMGCTGFVLCDCSAASGLPDSHVSQMRRDMGHPGGLLERANPAELRSAGQPMAAAPT